MSDPTNPGSYRNRTHCIPSPLPLHRIQRKTMSDIPDYFKFAIIIVFIACLLQLVFGCSNKLKTDDFNIRNHPHCIMDGRGKITCDTPKELQK